MWVATAEALARYEAPHTGVGALKTLARPLKEQVIAVLGWGVRSHGPASVRMPWHGIRGPRALGVAQFLGAAGAPVVFSLVALTRDGRP